MKTESMLATEKMLDVVKTLLDEEQPENLFSKILEVAKGVLHADAAVLDISGENPLHFSNPEQVSISISAVKQAKSEKRAVVWNQLDDDGADLSKSIVQNQLTSIMVSPFRTPDSESGYLYLQRAAREEPFTEEDSALFDAFVEVCEKFAFAAYDRLRDKESLDVLKNVVRKDGIVYSCKAMAELVALAEKLALLPLPVIIRGETGTGKEVFARFIHNHSPRADRPFIAVNCGAIPEHLIESLLFGHARGSFTGAIDTRKGFFEDGKSRKNTQKTGASARLRFARDCAILLYVEFSAYPSPKAGVGNWSFERNAYVFDRRARQSGAELRQNAAQRGLSGAGRACKAAGRAHQNEGLFRAVRRRSHRVGARRSV